MVTTARKAQEIYSELDQLNTHHHEVDAKLRRLRSDVNLSGIFVRDYLLDVAREHAPEYRDTLASFQRTNIETLNELRGLDTGHAARIDSLQAQLDEYWRTFEPLFDWTATEKIFRAASFLRREVVPRREAILAIAQDIEELNNANLDSQRGEVTRREAAFRSDLRRLLAQTTLLGAAVALIAVLRLRTLERRAEQQRAFAEDAEQQMRQLSQRVVATQEEERKHLSRELHDHVGQVLTALRMELRRVERAHTSGDARLGPVLAECRGLVDQLFRTVRDLALGLRPSMLDDLGLHAALEWHVRDLTRRYGIDVTLDLAGDLAALPDWERTSVYRAIQEALTNCIRHANATLIAVSVSASGRCLDVAVCDNGIGFDASKRHDGFGLRGIEERVREARGTMTISSEPGRGTTLRIRLPLDEKPMGLPLARAAG
jgi:signal transduction histidine kinase